ncbi:hypothetical protein MJO28_000983 [Puccinia striiformis f. sp. tritici]|uniref:Uncharacterized protein n=1 Tax=Puccinia striiformis f. sp. tritici TaxID=168172 RepID=A0ACC0F0L0_9BASI|nr:hypothetical protein Pst134EA_000272 [Puccinia striiformis f. sp. tritici]KAH9473195.1 hypothetical protein Pst134EA_000272 [Puccinia striiformis f. sp. tritici]KAI7962889.1 hypothetical protein MJO28_000983 [Puccinia striiformis f. sp. tritici]
MMNFRFALIAVMSLLAAHPQCAVASDGKDPTTCFTDVKVIRTDCTKALRDIIYDASGETTVQRISGGCYVQINKPSGVGISQAQVQSSVDKILNTCSPQAGSTKLTVKGAEVLVKLGNRSPKDSWKKPFDADFPYDQETCLSVTGTKPIDIRDCMQAFRMIPVDPSGTTFAFRQERRTEITVQQNTCELKISTSDGSPIVASISQVMSAMTKLFKCDTKWGIISIRGAGGPNGRTYIQVQSV